MKNKYFTLLELLIVIAIIGILVTILLPSLQKARDKAELAICMSNFAQQSIGIEGYLKDHDNRYPSHVIHNGMDLRAAWGGITPLNSDRAAYSSYGYEKRVLNPYMNVPDSANAKIFSCPSMDGVRFAETGNVYAATTKMGGNVKDITHSTIKRYRARVNNPKEMILMINNKIIKVVTNKSLADKFLSHNSFYRSPTLFIDGHVAIKEFNSGNYDYDGYTFNNQ